jgi:hypothetical protein
MAYFENSRGGWSGLASRESTERNPNQELGNPQNIWTGSLGGHTPRTCTYEVQPGQPATDDEIKLRARGSHISNPHCARPGPSSSAFISHNGHYH